MADSTANQSASHAATADSSEPSDPYPSEWFALAMVLLPPGLVLIASIIGNYAEHTVPAAFMLGVFVLVFAMGWYTLVPRTSSGLALLLGAALVVAVAFAGSLYALDRSVIGSVPTSSSRPTTTVLPTTPASVPRLRGAVLDGADLRNVDLDGADLRGISAAGTRLSGASLRGADLRAARLAEADLSGACLRNSDLRGADIDRANFHGADLQGANVDGLDSAAFPGASQQTNLGACR